MAQSNTNLIFCLVFLTSICAGLTTNDTTQNHPNLVTSSPSKRNCQNELFPEPPCCGVSNELLGRSESGVALAVNEFPWIVYINGTRKSDFCSGSLINSRWVLTTAGCIFNSLGDEWKLHVYVKSEKPDNVPGASDVQKFVVIKTIFHELYDSLTEEKSIALLLLNEPVVFGYVLKPICLPSATSTNDFVGKIGIVVPWQPSTRNIDPVPKMSAEVLDLQSCKEYDKNFASEICVNSTANSMECYEETGGPLMLQLDNDKKNVYNIIGVKHFAAKGCVNPDAYVNVTNYLKWIKDTIMKNQQL